jgi:phospholipid-transporting ATPase
MKNFVPRGSVLKNSEDVYAMVLYTGSDTKLIMNEGKYQFKLSFLGRTMNKYMLINIVIMIFLVIIVTQILNRSWHSSHGNHTYIFPEQPVDVTYWSSNTIISFFLLCNGIIPLDLAITITLSKLAYVLVVEADAQMVSEEKSLKKGAIQGCVVRNLELIQDFSLVNNLFCDKTGTLTRNELIFSCLAVDGETFTVDNGFENFKSKVQGHQASETYLNFWRCLSICHEVDAIRVEGSSAPASYQGASQDEVTFLNMSRDAGFAEFKERARDDLKIEINGNTESYKVLRIIEFTSDRKKMSVIAKRDQDGKVFNFIKGADVAMIPRLSQASSGAAQ